MATSITNTSVTTDDLTVDTSTLNVPLTSRDGYKLFYGADAKAAFTVLPNTGEIRIGAATTGTSGNYYTEIMSRNGSNLVTAIKADTNGWVTMPQQPHCMLHKSGNQAISAGTPTAVTGWAVSNGLNSMFNSSNNRIIAPVGGTYIVGGGIQFSQAGGVHINILKNSAMIGTDSYLDFGANGSAGAAAYSMVIPMSTNDYISVNVYNTVACNVNQNRTKLWMVKVS